MDQAALYAAMLARSGGFPPGMGQFLGQGNLEQFPTPFGAAAFQAPGMPEAAQLISMDQLIALQSQLRAVELEIKNRSSPIKTTEEEPGKSDHVASLADPDDKPPNDSDQPLPNAEQAKPCDDDITTGHHGGHHPSTQAQDIKDPSSTQEQQQQPVEGLFNPYDPNSAEEMLKAMAAIQQAALASSFFGFPPPPASGSEFPQAPSPATSLFIQQQQEEFFRQMQQYINQQSNTNTNSKNDTATTATTTTTITTAANPPPVMMIVPPHLLPSLPLPHTHTNTTTAASSANGFMHHNPYFAKGVGGPTVTTASGLLPAVAAAAAQQQLKQQAGGDISNTATNTINNNTINNTKNNDTTSQGTALPSRSASIPAARGAARAASGLCQIPGCCARLTEIDFRTGHPRFQMCKIHKDALDIDIEGNLHRFCQQCGRLQLSLDFDGLKRSCRQSLERHNARRRAVRAAKRAGKLTSYGSAPLPYDATTMAPYGGAAGGGASHYHASSLATLATVTAGNARSIGTKRGRNPGPGNFSAHGIGHKQRVEDYMELEQASKAAIAAVKAENTAMYDALAGLLSVAEAEAEKEKEALEALNAIAFVAAAASRGDGTDDADNNNNNNHDNNNADDTIINKNNNAGYGNVEIKMEDGFKQEEVNNNNNNDKEDGSLPDTDDTTVMDIVACDHHDDINRPLKRVAVPLDVKE